MARITYIDSHGVRRTMDCVYDQVRAQELSIQAQGGTILYVTDLTGDATPDQRSSWAV